MGLLSSRLAQAAVRLENVAPARFDAREAPVLVGRAQQRGGSVHGRERAVVVAAKALQQTGRLETMPGQLPLTRPLRHRGAFADERRAVVLASNALVQTATAEILGAVTAVAGRQQRPHGVERSVEGGRIAAPRIGEANERGYLRRSIVLPRVLQLVTDKVRELIPSRRASVMATFSSESAPRTSPRALATR